MTTPSNRIKVATVAGISAALVLAGCSTTGTEAPRSPSGSEDAVATRSAPNRGPTYADGRYTAKGWYGSLPSNIDVADTLDDEVVTAVEVTPNATDPTSLDYQ